MLSGTGIFGRLAGSVPEPGRLVVVPSRKAGRQAGRHRKSDRDRTTDNTDIVEELVQNRQKLRDEGNFQATDWMTKVIRKQVKMEKNFYRIKHLEEELWYDIKKAKTGFVPNHTKLLKDDGKIATSKERPDCLADYVRHKH